MGWSSQITRVHRSRRRHAVLRGTKISSREPRPGAESMRIVPPAHAHAFLDHRGPRRAASSSSRLSRPSNWNPRPSSSTVSTSPSSAAARHRTTVRAPLCFLTLTSASCTIAPAREPGAAPGSHPSNLSRIAHRCLYHAGSVRRDRSGVRRRLSSPPGRARICCISSRTLMTSSRSCFWICVNGSVASDC